MTPKEKANELVNKYFVEIESADTYAFNLPSMNLHIAKKCALIAVDEVINQCRIMDGGFSFEKEMEFWQRVKREIENL